MHPSATAGDTTTWQLYAAALASKATHPASAWARILSSVPRHEFAPRWWKSGRPEP